MTIPKMLQTVHPGAVSVRVQYLGHYLFPDCGAKRRIAGRNLTGYCELGPGQLRLRIGFIDLGQFQTAVNGPVLKGDGIGSRLDGDFFWRFANVALRHRLRQAVLCPYIQLWHQDFAGSVRSIPANPTIPNPRHPFLHGKGDT